MASEIAGGLAQFLVGQIRQARDEPFLDGTSEPVTDQLRTGFFRKFCQSQDGCTVTLPAAKVFD